MHGSGASFISVSGSDLIVSNQTLFSNNTSTSGKGLAINCESCTKVDVTETDFEHMKTDGAGGAISLDKTCETKIQANFANITAQLGGAVSAKDSTVTLQASKFSKVGQSFVYNTTTYEPNLLNEFKGQGFSPEAFASVNVECTDPSIIGNGVCGNVEKDDCTAGNSCCITIARSSFKESGNFEPVIPPDPIVPQYPRLLGFKVPGNDFTKNMTLGALTDDEELVN